MPLGAGGWGLRVTAQSPEPRAQSLDGFTLIEIAFVTAILALLLALSMPRFQSTLERLRLEQAVTHLSQTLRAARERAVAEAQPITWVWEEASHRSHLEGLSPQGLPQRLEDRNVPPASLPAFVELQMLRDNRDVPCLCVRFFPDGTSDPTTTLGFKRRNQQLYTITVHETTGSTCLAAGTAAC